MSAEAVDQVPPLTDERLIADARRGSERAGAILISTHAPRLVGYAVRVAGDLPPSDRDVLCELAVEKAVAKIDRFDVRRGSFDAWLRGFLRHEIASWRRRHHETLTGSWDAIAVPPADDHAGDDRRRRRIAQVHAAMEKLSPADQLILRLHTLEGLPFAAVAELIGDVTETACRQRHHRAVVRLRDALESIPQVADDSDHEQENDGYAH